MACSFIETLSRVIDERISSGDPRSYTYRLYRGGLGQVGKKVGEEAVEVVVAAMSGDRSAVVNEAADLIYHLLVLLRSMKISFDEVCAELERRHRAGVGYG